jgi:phytoene synthase
VSPDEYCAAKAAPRGSSLAHAVAVLRPERRAAMLAVHALCRELRDVAREVADPAVARLKLGYWRTELASAFEGKPQHPVTQALAPKIAAFRLPRALFDALLDGVAADLDRPIYETFAVLEAHCAAVAGSVWRLSVEICGGSHAAAHDFGRELGIALQLTSFIRTLGADAPRGRVYVPQDDLVRFGVETSSLMRRATTPALIALLAHQAARARSRYDSALAALVPAERRAQRPGIIMAALGRTLLWEIERDGFRVLDRRLALTPWLKAWIAWKASWAR